MEIDGDQSNRLVERDLLFASAAASSAYVTVSEIFPLEMRALAIALFTRSAPVSAACSRHGCWCAHGFRFKGSNHVRLLFAGL